MNECWQIKVLLSVVSSCVLAEFLGYWLHRLLHNSRMRILSSSHMRHHLLLYGPKQNQRPSEHYMDATVGRVALGNIGLEWLVPSTLVLGASLGMFWLLGVRMMYQAIYVVVVLGWSFVTFNYLHDRMHIKGFWMERNRWTRSWFLTARTLHDVHHRTLNDAGRMDKNFGIGFFLFDRLFGTLALQQAPFNHTGYEAAQRLYN